MLRRGTRPGMPITDRESSSGEAERDGGKNQLRAPDLDCYGSLNGGLEGERATPAWKASCERCDGRKWQVGWHRMERADQVRLMTTEDDDDTGLVGRTVSTMVKSRRMVTREEERMVGW